MRPMGPISPFTHRLTVAVLLATCFGLYYKARLKPLRADLARDVRTEIAVAGELEQARTRVARLEAEAESARRWAGYATVLEAQSTGKSLSEVLNNCGGAAGPDLEVKTAEFERRDPVAGMQRIDVNVVVEGPYRELIRLFGEIDRIFPPVELRRASLSQPESETDAARGVVVAQLEGVIHEPSAPAVAR